MTIAATASLRAIPSSFPLLRSGQQERQQRPFRTEYRERRRNFRRPHATEAVTRGYFTRRPDYFAASGFPPRREGGGPASSVIRRFSRTGGPSLRIRFCTIRRMNPPNAPPKASVCVQRPYTRYRVPPSRAVTTPVRDSDAVM